MSPRRNAIATACAVFFAAHRFAALPPSEPMRRVAERLELAPCRTLTLRALVDVLNEVVGVVPLHDRRLA